jgi:hypothetical protein
LGRTALDRFASLVTRARFQRHRHT